MPHEWTTPRATGASPTALAQAQLPQASVDVLFWSGVLLLAVVALFVFALVLRRHLAAGSVGEQGHDTFALSDLRRMRDQGLMTEEEFQRAREKVLASFATPSNTTPAAPPAQDEPDNPPPRA